MKRSAEQDSYSASIVGRELLDIVITERRGVRDLFARHHHLQ